MLPPSRTEQPRDLLGGNKWSRCAQAQGLVSVLQGIPEQLALITAEKDLREPSKPGQSAQVRHCHDVVALLQVPELERSPLAFFFVCTTIHNTAQRSPRHFTIWSTHKHWKIRCNSLLSYLQQIKEPEKHKGRHKRFFQIISEKHLIKPYWHCGNKISQNLLRDQTQGKIPKENNSSW